MGASTPLAVLTNCAHVGEAMPNPAAAMLARDPSAGIRLALRISKVEHASPQCDHHGMRAIGGIELWKNALHVRLDGPFRDIELCRD